MLLRKSGGRENIFTVVSYLLENIHINGSVQFKRVAQASTIIFLSSLNFSNVPYIL